MIRYISILLLIFSSLLYSQKLSYELHIEHDNDNIKNIKYYTGYIQSLGNLDLIVKGGLRDFSYYEYNNFYTEVLLGSKFTSKYLNFNGNISQLISEPWSPVLFNSNVGINIGNLGIELLYERDLVGTALSNEYELKSDIVGGSLELKTFKHFVVVGGLYENKINESKRIIQKYRLIYMTPIENFYLFTKIKLINKHSDIYYGLYFDPESLGEYSIGIGINSMWLNDNLRFRFRVSGGYQRINGEVNNMLFESDINTKINIFDIFDSQLIFGVSNASTNFQANYLYMYGSLTIFYIL